jgi:hypothetical protein
VLVEIVELFVLRVEKTTGVGFMERVVLYI